VVLLLAINKISQNGSKTKIFHKLYLGIFYTVEKYSEWFQLLIAGINRLGVMELWSTRPFATPENN
jgi:hypothetical protein